MDRNFYDISPAWEAQKLNLANFFTSFPNFEEYIISINMKNIISRKVCVIKGTVVKIGQK